MASTSTQLRQDGTSLLSGSSSWKYDVFLSFRGTDTRKGFVDHLYSALHEKVIFTFKDDPRLERGESIYPALLKAIKESRFAVVIFSENYASSKWCLEELVEILECQKERALTVLPVFYKVDPSDLRKQRGSVGEAFAQHERDFSEEEEKVQRWRNALTEAANISGWDSETQGPEAKLVRDIAIDILNRLGHNGSSVLEGYVGLLPRIEEVMSKLEMGLDLDGPRIVGICGMGGIGKTIIAKAVYHQIRTQFVGSCYLPNVREEAGRHGLESLQKSLLVDILSVLDSDIKIRNIDWAGSIRNAIGNKRVLVILDDVDHSDQLDALVGELHWFGLGSRIIITTRDEHLLNIYGPRSHVYNVKGLNGEEAFKLFCCKAFWNNKPMPGFEDLIKSAIDYAKGVPLALKVLGRFLIGKKVNEWQSAIRRLRQEPNPDIQKVLKLSYDGLGREEKKIFLDIACFFKWYDMEYSTVVNMLDACGFQANIGISRLKDRALVTIRGNMIDMHDLIQEMGKHIVNEESPKEPGRRSRLWKKEDIYHTLTKKTGTEAVETILFYTYKISLSPDTFSKMNNLRLLQLYNVQLPNGLDYLSNDLRLLAWHKYPLKCLPSNFQPDNLVTLKMSHSRLEQPWNGRMCLSKLKFVDLSYSPYITKNLDFTQVANLKELRLEGCTNIVEISSIEAIKGLMVLNLEGLKHLKVLPTGCWLKSLKELILSGCSKLKNVSDILASTEFLIRLRLDGTCVMELPVEHLSNLKFISLKDCKKLTSLPRGICGLKLLETLNVTGCSKLRELPENIGGLERLQNLYVSSTGIKRLPSSVIHLKELEELFLCQCKAPTTSTLDDLGSLSSLEALFLSGSNIISLPASIRDLYKLKYLGLTNCKKLKTLPYLPTNINYIDAGGCTSLETFLDPAILLRELGTANFTNCHTLIRNRPSLPLELLRNYLQGVPTDKSLGIAVSGREIPKCFSNQNNMGHYVRIQLMPDRYQRLSGFVICAVFEAKAPSIDADAECEVRCYVMWNDDEVSRMTFSTYISQFQPYYLLLHYISIKKAFGYRLDEIRGKGEVNDLKKNEIIFYFRVDEEWSQDPEVIAPVKCAVHAVYENDEEWPDPHSSIQLSDCDDEYGSTERTQGVVSKKRSCHNHDYKADGREQSKPKRLRENVVQGRDSQSELLEISIENIINSKPGWCGFGYIVYF